MAGLSAEFRTYGYFGELDPDALTLNYTSDAAWRRARSFGHVSGLRLLSEAEYSGRKYLKHDASEADTAHAISLDFRLLWPEAFNVMTAWSNGVDPFNNYFREAPAQWRTGQGLAHTDSTPDTMSTYRLDLEPTARIPENGAWALKLHLYRTPAEQTRTAFFITWGAWLILIHEGGAEVARPSADYTTALQLELLDLLSIEEPTPEQQTDADDLAELIYTDRHSLSTPLGDEGWYNTPLEFVAIPEPAGRLHLRVNGVWEIIEHSEIITSGQYGVLWPETYLNLRSEGGSYYWQAGYPAANPLGTMRLGRYKTGRWTQYNNWPNAANIIADENGGTVGVTNDIYAPDEGELRLSLEPDETRRRFPFLYHTSVAIEAGARDGGSAADPATWDSDDYNKPIVDIQPSIEGVHRTTQYDVHLRDPLTTNFGGWHLEHQVAVIVIDGTAVLNNGLVTESVAADAAGVADLGDPELHRSSTRVINTVCDAWARLDEDVMDDAPMGDGLRVGAYVKRILINGGFYGYVSGISDNAGRILPAAVGGEAPLFVPRDGITRGDYLRSIVEEWGMGLILYPSLTGQWTLEMPSTAPLYNFTNGGTPGAYRILRELELPREVGEYSNWFRLYSTDRRGNAIQEEFPLWKSIRNNSSRTFIGRKKLESREVPAAKTEQDLYYVRRSIYEQFKGTPRFHAFDTSFIKGIRPGQYCTHNGVLCRIRSVGGGSIATNRVGLTLQEMED
jgi:hypothetical protein